MTVSLMDPSAECGDADCVPAFRILSRLIEAAGVQPQVAVILGSGLGQAGDRVLFDGGIAVPYSDLPGMPSPAVAGHSGRLIIGTGAHAGILLLQGRVHWYEGHSLSVMTFGTRLMAAIGVCTLVVSNAAGGVSPGFQPGHLMLISGHWTLLNIQECALDQRLAGRSDLGDRLWNSRLRSAAFAVPTRLTLHEGCYAMMSGPNYETPAEVRMLQRLQVDAVGMSTIPEAIAAARRGLRVLGVSCITNVASGLSDAVLDHADVSETAASIEAEFTTWLLRVCGRIMTDCAEPAE
ncbi:MAG: purine-nucleoside phosphorylase [Planctomycetaceae bacterium]